MLNRGGASLLSGLLAGEMHNLCLLGIELNPICRALGNSLIEKGLSGASCLNEAITDAKNRAIVRVPKPALFAANAVN